MTNIPRHSAFEIRRKRAIDDDWRKRKAQRVLCHDCGFHLFKADATLHRGEFYCKPCLGRLGIKEAIH